MNGYSESAPVWIASVDMGADGGRVFGAFATSDAAKKFLAVTYPILKLNWVQSDREYAGAPKQWVSQFGSDTYTIQEFDVLSEDEIA